MSMRPARAAAKVQLRGRTLTSRRAWIPEPKMCNSSTSVRSQVDARPMAETRARPVDFRIRTLRAEDWPAEARFLEEISTGCRRYRFLGQIADSTGLLARGLTQFDFECDTSFGAFVAHGAQDEIAGVARYSIDADGGKCECTVTLSNRWADPDLALRLMRRLVELAQERGIRSLYAIDEATNAGMRELAERLGFESRRDPLDPRLCVHRLELRVEEYE